MSRSHDGFENGCWDNGDAPMTPPRTEINPGIGWVVVWLERAGDLAAAIDANETTIDNDEGGTQWPTSVS
jgi:hypothetical protein